MALREAEGILREFGFSAGARITELAGGLINSSYKVTPAGADESYLLQRINPAVFPDGGAVMRNLASVTRHLEHAARQHRLPAPERRVLRLLSTPNGEPAVRAADGAFWRLLHFIGGARAIERVRTEGEAREVGRAFGQFHALMRGYNGPALEVTIPDFHNTPLRLVRLEEAARCDSHRRTGSLLSKELPFVASRLGYATLLTGPVSRGEIPAGISHNDAKPSNVLLDAETGAALAVIDLDTVMPGTPLFDVGDLIRSVCCSRAEDHPVADEVELRPDLFAALAQGFLHPDAGHFEPLSPAERALFVTAGLVITYEQGIRFLTDYLEGDRYYRVIRPGQNLDRARVQFRLLAALEARREALESVVAADR